MRMQRFAQTTLLGVLGLFAMGAAHAGSGSTATYNLGTLGSTPTSLTETVPVGTFSDDLNFTISAANSYTYGSAQSISLSYQAPNSDSWISVYNIYGLTASLYAVGSPTPVPGAITQGNTLSAVLSPGNYFFNLTGQATGLNGGQYVIDAAAIAAPVPEPAEAILMALGFGWVGFLALRNKQRA